MRPKICKDNGVNIPTSDCSTCEVLEQKVDALTEELENKQDILTEGDYIEIEENVISADLSDFYDKTAVDTMVNGINGVSFLVVDELPETGDNRTIYLVSNGDGYDQYVYTNNTWTDIGSTSTANVQTVYPILGVTELTSGWLSLTDGGTAITPSQGIMYILVKGSESVGVGNILRWDGSAYKVVSDGGVVKGDYHGTDLGGNDVARLTWNGGRLNPNKLVYTMHLNSFGELSSEVGGTTTTYATNAALQAVDARIPTSVRTWSDTLTLMTGTTGYPTGAAAQLATWAFSDCTCIGMLTATFDANSTADRQVGATLNGTTPIGVGTKIRAASTGVTVLSIPIITRMEANDYLRFEAWQNSGSQLNVTLTFHALYITD